LGTKGLNTIDPRSLLRSDSTTCGCLIVSGFLSGIIVWLLVSLLIVTWYARMGAQALERARVDQDLSTQNAIAYFERAVRWAPSDPWLQRWLAHAYKLQGQHDKALRMLEHAHHLQPDSLLITYELASAYCRNDRPDQAIVLYQALGISTQRLFESADKELLLGKPDKALETYLDAVCLAGGYDKPVAFRIGVAAAAVQDPQAPGWLEYAGFDLAAQTYASEPTTLRIEVEDLHYLFDESIEHDGRPLTDWPSHDPSIGALWWSGTAVAFVSSETIKPYVLRLRAQHPRPPVEYAVVVNGVTIQQFAYDRADDSWEENSAVVQLRGGLNVVGIRLVDGTYSAHGDRNGFVDWITLTPLADS